MNQTSGLTNSGLAVRLCFFFACSRTRFGYPSALLKMHFHAAMIQVTAGVVLSLTLSPAHGENLKTESRAPYLHHIPLRDANVWIHPNQAGFRDRFASGQPFRVELDTGIAVWPARLPGAPRLPLLGIRALRRADLRVWIDCRKCQVWMSTRRGFWFFG